MFFSKISKVLRAWGNQIQASSQSNLRFTESLCLVYLILTLFITLEQKKLIGKWKRNWLASLVVKEVVWHVRDPGSVSLSESGGRSFWACPSLLPPQAPGVLILTFLSIFHKLFIYYCSGFRVNLLNKQSFGVLLLAHSLCLLSIISWTSSLPAGINKYKPYTVSDALMVSLHLMVVFIIIGQCLP